MNLNTPDLSPFITTINGERCYIEDFVIPAWDMDSNQFINIPHGHGAAFRPVGFTPLIGSDIQIAIPWYPRNLCHMVVATGICNGSVGRFDDTNIVLFRSDTGEYNDPAYSNALLQRGILTVLYYLV